MRVRIGNAECEEAVVKQYCLCLAFMWAGASFASAQEVPPAPRPTILPPGANPIDLASALRLAGVQNPEIQIAQERVVEAVALRQLAAVQILPTLNAGFNYDNHAGNLQRSIGAITRVDRSSLYLGMGANAVGGGTVNIPGVVLHGNISEGIFANLVARQVVPQRSFASAAVRNDVLLRVATAYLELLRAEGHVAVSTKSREEAREVARVTANYAKTGQGRQADADRAATELEQREADVSRSEGEVLTASARLCELLSLDPAVRLRPIDGWVVPAPVVPDPIPVAELIAIALAQRPELQERQAAVRAAFLELRGAKLLPFSPNVILGYSAGSFGGGSEVATALLGQPRFDSFAGRQDFDIVVYWTLRNLGVGNVAMIRLARSNLRASDLSLVEVLDRVRTEVAAAYARTHARYAQIDSGERAVRSSQNAFDEDLRRTRNREGFPIEVLDSLRLLTRSRVAYLDAIIDYNRAQFELYVALGQPPAEFLARPVPASLVPPPAEATAPPSPK
jgi:outer membrane protein TolC